MLRLIIAAICSLALAQQPTSQPASEPAESQPSTQPATRPTVRDPEQVEILKTLLNRQDRAMLVRPQAPEKPGQEMPTSQATDPEGNPLLLEGTFLSERPGRLAHEDARAKFICYVDSGGQSPRTIEILPSQLLEAMEREAEAGFSDFIVSGEVMRYRGRNYLLLRKILRRVDNGNLGP
jgi:hypothetical protein